MNFRSSATKTLFLVLFFSLQCLTSLAGIVKGTVRDTATGKPLPGAIVKANDGGDGDVTDINGEYSFEVGAMAKNEAMAMGSAFRKINPRKPEIKAFMASVREKIEKYYIDRTPVLIAKAQQLADSGEFDQALAVLSTIPESVSEYMTVSEMMRTVHQQMIDKYALMSIQEAKNNMILKKYPEALDCLLYVDPMSNHAKEAKAMVNQIQQTIEANDRAAYEARIKAQEQKMEMAQRAQDNEVMLKKMQLEASYTAAEKVNKESSESLSDKVSSWLFGKLK